jgi:hypothetical protein
MSHQRPEHIGFDETHHAVIGTVEFPHDEVFDRLDGTSPPESTPEHPEAMTLAADGLREVLTWAWSSPTGKTVDVRASFIKWLAISATMRPELFDSMTYKQLGERAGCTRANLSKAAIRFTERFGGLQFRRQRNASGRAGMRAARIRTYQKQKHENTSHPPTP